MSTGTQARRRGGRTSILALGALAASALAVAPAAAQHPPGAAYDVLFGPTGPLGAPLTSPGFGPVGSLIALTPKDLPANKPVQLMIGAVRSGFEVVAETVTDSEGRIGGSETPSLEVPDWVETDRAYLVIVADRDYQPLDRADFFHPTAADGTLSRTGRIAGHGTCTLLVNDQRRYVLVGDTGGWTEGPAEVVVTGTAEPAGSCGDGIAIRVRSIRAS